MSLLIGITGNMYAGKNTLADMFVAARPELGLQVSGWADILKESALAIDPWIPLEQANRPLTRRLSDLVRAVGWDGAKKYPAVREFLQRLGSEGGRDIHGEDCWVDAWFRAHPNWRYESHIIADTRFDNEAAAITKRGGIVIRIRRPETDVAAGEHRSEAGVDPSLLLMTINNTGNLRALQDMAERFARTFQP